MSLKEFEIISNLAFFLLMIIVVFAITIGTVWIFRRNFSQIRRYFKIILAVSVILFIIVLIPSFIVKSKKISCTRAGGDLRIAGFSGEYKCYYPYSDGGKICKDSSECQGGCVVFDTKNLETGICKPDDYPFGCFSTIETARKGGLIIICRD